jgi:muramoyltetrapeptide carboxypeptidase LdcA involved in peptidoglycan recycling
VSGASRPLVNPAFAQLKAVLLCRFLAVKERPLDAFDFYKRAEAARKEDRALRVPVKSSCKVGHCQRTLLKNFVVNLKYFSLH